MIVIDMYAYLIKKGNDAANANNYVDAIAAFTEAIELMPYTPCELLRAYSNRAAMRLNLSSTENDDALRSEALYKAIDDLTFVRNTTATMFKKDPGDKRLQELWVLKSHLRGATAWYKSALVLWKMDSTIPSTPQDLNDKDGHWCKNIVPKFQSVLSFISSLSALKLREPLETASLEDLRYEALRAVYLAIVVLSSTDSLLSGKSKSMCVLCWCEKPLIKVCKLSIVHNNSLWAHLIFRATSLQMLCYVNC
jgi:hypothetical protein